MTRIAIATEPAAWRAIAETLTMCESMPPSYSYRTGEVFNSLGLCDVVLNMYEDGLIDMRTYERMRTRLVRTVKASREAHKQAAHTNDGYVPLWAYCFLAPQGEWKPRVTWAKRFARAAAKEPLERNN